MPKHHRIAITDEEHVSAVHHESESDRWIIFCHGFVSDMTGSYEMRANRAVSEGYNAVRFDFRGCGDSDGSFIDQTLSTKITDLCEVVKHFSPETLVLFGSSFGGKVAFHAVREFESMQAIITRAPVTYNETFSELEQTVRTESTVQLTDSHSIDYRFFEDLPTYSFDETANNISIPVAIFHGAADESVPISSSLTACESLASQCDVFFQVYHDEGHRFTREAENRLQQQLFDWLVQYG